MYIDTKLINIMAVGCLTMEKVSDIKMKGVSSLRHKIYVQYKIYWFISYFQYCVNWTII